MKLRWKKGMAGDQRGAFIVFTALAIWFIMMFIAFAVDFGNYYQHRARLQNAADAAALAGVAKYADEDMGVYTSTEGKGRLINIPTIAMTDGIATFTSDSFLFTKLVGVPSVVHDQAEGYVLNDYVQENPQRSGVGMNDSVWSATKESTTEETTADGYKESTTSTPKQYCYRVDLEDKIPTFFARIFGMNELTVSVSAMAMLDGTEVSTVKERLIKISGNLNDIIPNYYWETIVEARGKIKDLVTGQEELTITDPNTPDKTFGSDNIHYLTSQKQVDSEAVFIPGALVEEGTGRLIIGYQEPADKNGIVADPIYADPSVSASTFTDRTEKNGDVGTLWYNITDSFITRGTEDIIGLFIDRDNISNNNNSKGIWYGSKERFTLITLNSIHGYNSNVPIYARIESEPVHMAAQALTTVHSIRIEVKLTEAELDLEGTKGRNVKPFVLAYDGPDPNRAEEYPGSNVGGDAPWIATKAITNVGGYNYRDGQINSSAEPLLPKYGGKRADVPAVMVQTSITTPGPIVVHIPHNCVFHGAIFAPRSQVTITGSGKIHGFIAAREIKVEHPERFIHQTAKISMPVLASIRRAGTTNRFDYERYYIEDEYDLIFSRSDDICNNYFVDYTDKSFLPQGRF